MQPGFRIVPGDPPKPLAEEEPELPLEHGGGRSIPPFALLQHYHDLPPPPVRHPLFMFAAVALVVIAGASFFVFPKPKPPADAGQVPLAPAAAPVTGLRTQPVPGGGISHVQPLFPPAGTAPTDPGTIGSAPPQPSFDQPAPDQGTTLRFVPAPPGDPNEDPIARYMAQAVMGGDFDAMTAMLDHGADPNADIRPGEPALARAAWRGDAGGAAILLAHGAEVDQPDSEGYTPLIWAASNGRVSTIRILLKYRADPNRRENRGRTALMHAVWNRHVDAAKVLAEAGASLELKDNEGHDVAYYARLGDNPEVMDYINSRLALLHPRQ